MGLQFPISNAVALQVGTPPSDGKSTSCATHPMQATILKLELTHRKQHLDSQSPARDEVFAPTNSRQSGKFQNDPCLIADRKRWTAQGTSQAPAGQGGHGSNNHADEVGSRLALLALALRA